MEDLIKLENKVVVITGGGSGAGSSIVEEFSKCGCKIAFTYNNSEAKANELIDNLKKKGVVAKAYKYQQNSLDSIDEIVDRIVEDFKTIDVLVNNAGIYPNKPVNEISEKDWDDMLDINTKGVFFLSRKVCEYMKDNNGGSIINISSINAINPNKNLVHYGTSKRAVEMITSSLAVCYGPKVRVNCVAPGLIYRENIEQFIPNWVDSYNERSPLKRLVNPEEIGKACVFLASDLASAVTGQTLTVDCGITLAPCFNNED